jgi:hypothetical protein
MKQFIITVISILAAVLVLHTVNSINEVSERKHAEKREFARWRHDLDKRKAEVDEQVANEPTDEGKMRLLKAYMKELDQEQYDRENQ